jgi:UDP-glucose 4-epimerase
VTVSGKIVVTGASGFLGSWVVRVLAMTSNEILPLVREDSNLGRLRNIANIDVFRGSPRSWNALIRRAEPSAVIACDWWGVGNEERNDNAQYSNIPRWSDLAETCREAGVETFVALGSQAELGPVSDEITESCPDNPTTIYGEAKVSARQHLQEIFEGSNTRLGWLRIFSTYGQLDSDNWLIPSVVDHLRRNEIMNMTSGQQEWSYLHAYDFARAVVSVIDNPSICDVINVGNPKTVSIADVALLVGEYLGKSDLLRLGVLPYRDDQVMKMSPKTAKLNSIGWYPLIETKRGIIETVDWLCGKETESLTTGVGNKVRLNLPSRIEILLQ